jgi:Domain of unknown function (DUF4412)
MPRRTAFALLLLLTAAASGADTLLTVRSSIQGLKIAPSQAEPIRIWVHGDQGEEIRRDEGDTTYILRLDRGKLYVINHADKTYSELALPIDPRKINAPPEMQVRAQVTATDETRKIGSWNARRYKVDITNPAGLRLETTFWASKDIAAHPAVTRLNASIAALQPGSADWSLKLGQIEGFPVLQEADVTMGNSRFKTREELIAVETKDAPAGAYDPPAGYTVQAYAGAPQQ